MSHMNVNQAWWNSSYSSKHQIPQCVSQSLSLKMEVPPKLNHVSNEIGLRVQEHESSSTQSGSQSQSQSHHEIVATGGTNSSVSGQDDSYENNAEGLLKPVMFLPPSNHAFNHPQVDYIHQMTHYPYPYVGPHFAGLMAAACRPQTMLQPQTMGIAPARVPLPLDLVEDGPIYVNAKQYNGIMRRRQTRAKLEAQNKLVKSRKPYLHESRHIHALKRVRGSGGRFLSTKMLEQAESSTNASSNMITYGGDNKNFSSNGVTFGQSEGRFLGIPSHMGRTTMPGVEMRNGTQQRAPVVR